MWLLTTIDILKSDFKTDADKIVWFLLVMFVPVIGAILYFFMGSSKKTATEHIGRSTRYRDIGRD